MRTIQLARASRDPLVEEIERYAEVYHPAYRDGHRLVSGGIGDQPARYVALIRLIQEVESTLETQLFKITKDRTNAE